MCKQELKTTKVFRTIITKKMHLGLLQPCHRRLDKQLLREINFSGEPLIIWIRVFALDNFCKSVFSLSQLADNVKENVGAAKAKVEEIARGIDIGDKGTLGDLLFGPDPVCLKTKITLIKLIRFIQGKDRAHTSSHTLVTNKSCTCVGTYNSPLNRH